MITKETKNTTKTISDKGNTTVTNITQHIKNLPPKEKKDKDPLKKFLKRPMVNKKVLRDANRVTIVLNQPVYSRDKSRFFKEQWEEEKKQLFFS